MPFAPWRTSRECARPAKSVGSTGPAACSPGGPSGATARRRPARALLRRRRRRRRAASPSQLSRARARATALLPSPPHAFSSSRTDLRPPFSSNRNKQQCIRARAPAQPVRAAGGRVALAHREQHARAVRPVARQRGQRQRQCAAALVAARVGVGGRRLERALRPRRRLRPGRLHRRAVRGHRAAPGRPGRRGVQRHGVCLRADVVGQDAHDARPGRRRRRRARDHPARRAGRVQPHRGAGAGPRVPRARVVHGGGCS